MARTFIALTQAEIDVRIAESIKSREYELMGYDFELSAHQAVVDEIGSKLEWTAENEKYKGLSRDQFVRAAQKDGLTAEQIKTVADLLRLDFAKAGLAAVTIETAKSEALYEHAKQMLPPERREAAFAELAAKETAR